ncbi:MAG: AAA family ATPase [Nanoarchaeota archaeon]
MIIAIVGMCGAGKSEVADVLVEEGFGFLRPGQITMDIVKERGLEPTEENERPIREEMREKYGMAAYAILNIEKIEKMKKEYKHIVIDGLYSWEEYLEFKNRYEKEFFTLAVYSSPEQRYERLEKRAYNAKKDKEMRSRPFSYEDARARDKAEIENLNKAGPIAMSDKTIINNGSLDDLKEQSREFLKSFL